MDMTTKVRLMNRRIARIPDESKLRTVARVSKFIVAGKRRARQEAVEAARRAANWETETPIGAPGLAAVLAALLGGRVPGEM